MKTTTCALLGILMLATTCMVADARDVKTKDDFTKYDPHGNVVLQGKYIRDAVGKVIRYDVRDAHGKLMYSDIPYYRNDGTIIRCDTLDSDGSLIRVAVFFESTVKVFDKNGNHIPKYDSIYSHLNKE